MTRNEIFRNVVEALLELQETQPLSEIVFYPGAYEFESIDVYDLYECLLKLQQDFGVIENIYDPDWFEYPFNSDNPYPSYGLGGDINNQWQVSLSKLFPNWAKDFLGQSEASIFKIKSFQFETDRGLLFINGKRIKVTVDSNQYYLCRLLFKDENSIKTKIDSLTITDSVGVESMNIYQTGRYLNDKLTKSFNVDDIIVYTDKEVFINGKYL